MFELRPETLEHFRRDVEERAEAGIPVERMTEADLRAMSKLWGYDLPDAYAVFCQTYGDVSFPDEGQSEAEYTHREGEFSRVYTAPFTGFLDAESLKIMHGTLIVDPDNPSETPFFPPNCLPFGSDGAQNFFLLELGTEQARIWFWEDQPDGWGAGENTRLDYVSPDLVSFVNGLR